MTDVPFLGYQDKEIVLTTKHGKEEAIGPVFAKILGARVKSVELDTDTLGTFSGEIERIGNALDCVRNKCAWGLAESQGRYGLASEGSFGPHPAIPFIARNLELLYFRDQERGIELYLSEISLKTNYQMKVVSDLDELLTFAESAFFPSHGLIIRPHQPSKDAPLFKGIQETEKLREAFTESCRFSQDQKAWVETDMRAHLNPSRMKVIAELAEKLAQRLARRCPQCQAPGWGIVGQEKGLPCADCGFATEVLKFEVWGCTKCVHKEHCVPSHGLSSADPYNCLYCNP